MQFNILYGRILLAPLEEDCFNWLRFLLFLQGNLILQPSGQSCRLIAWLQSFEDDEEASNWGQAIPVNCPSPPLPTSKIELVLI